MISHKIIALQKVSTLTPEEKKKIFEEAHLINLRKHKNDARNAKFWNIGKMILCLGGFYGSKVASTLFAELYRWHDAAASALKTSANYTVGTPDELATFKEHNLSIFYTQWAYCTYGLQILFLFLALLYGNRSRGK